MNIRKSIYLIIAIVLSVFAFKAVYDFFTTGTIVVSFNSSKAEVIVVPIGVSPYETENQEKNFSIKDNDEFKVRLKSGQYYIYVNSLDESLISTAIIGVEVTPRTTSEYRVELIPTQTGEVIDVASKVTTPRLLNNTIYYLSDGVLGVYDTVNKSNAYIPLVVDDIENYSSTERIGGNTIIVESAPRISSLCSSQDNLLAYIYLGNNGNVFLVDNGIAKLIQVDNDQYKNIVNPVCTNGGYYQSNTLIDGANNSKYRGVTDIEFDYNQVTASVEAVLRYKNIDYYDSFIDHNHGQESDTNHEEDKVIDTRVLYYNNFGIEKLIDLGLVPNEILLGQQDYAYVSTEDKIYKLNLQEGDKKELISVFNTGDVRLIDTSEDGLIFTSQDSLWFYSEEQNMSFLLTTKSNIDYNGLEIDEDSNSIFFVTNQFRGNQPISQLIKINY